VSVGEAGRTAGGLGLVDGGSGIEEESDSVEVEVVRSGRLYGSYRFVERSAAVVFATRLRETFEGNGWAAA
jgi:hypothetical protein